MRMSQKQAKRLATVLEVARGYKENGMDSGKAYSALAHYTSIISPGISNVDIQEVIDQVYFYED